MKRSCTYILGGLFLLSALMGCSHEAPRAAAATEAPAPATAAPTAVAQVITETPAPAAEALQELLTEEAEPESDRILALCVSVTKELPCTVDLDGDGTEETLDLQTYVREDDGYPRWAVVLTRDGQEAKCETWVPCDTQYDLFVGDLDEDGAYEIFFQGDTASSDYLIYAFRHDLAPILFEADERLYRDGMTERAETFDAQILGFEDGHVVVTAFVDMLGTHWGVRSYAIGEEGTLGPMTTAWEFEAEEYLTVKAPLTAYAAKARQEAGEAFTLEAGERICPVCSDGCERMWFRTASGKTGVLQLTPDEDYLWLIDGKPETEYFEFLPYSG